MPKLAKFRLKMASRSLSEDLVEIQTQDQVVGEEVDGLSIDNLASIYDEELQNGKCPNGFRES